ncbi:hypothetical protein [Neobittarella massiliensis]|uniref:hypothetical protein n=1 Tax=Neobittarella massiliensis (ex Bilen et al. 2018) TaxID=2041842 RepID=UPI000CF5EA9D|nr:hypothetical protein [Neobittarella massiliensis]
MNTASEGIPFSCSLDETIIIYKAVVDNPQGTAVTVGQMMLDDFFRFKSHSSDTPIFPINLIPLASKKPVEERGKTGKDYHYTRTPDSESGRNDTDVSIVFFPSDCSEFHIMNNKTPPKCTTRPQAIPSRLSSKICLGSSWSCRPTTPTPRRYLP